MKRKAVDIRAGMTIHEPATVRRVITEVGQVYIELSDGRTLARAPDQELDVQVSVV